MGWGEKNLLPQGASTLCDMSILCRLSAVPQFRNNNMEIDSEDMQIHNTLKESSGQLEAVAKLFMKQGEGKAAQEVELNEEDEV
jgi:hypothetical protein